MALRSASGRGVVDPRLSKQGAMQHQVSSLTVDDLYEVPRASAAGGFAKVRRGIHRFTGKLYPVKTIDLSQIRADQRESLRQEVEVMKTLDHPNLVKIHESFEEDNKLHLVLELGDGGSVYDSPSASTMLELFEYFLLKTSVVYPSSSCGQRLRRHDSPTSQQ